MTHTGIGAIVQARMSASRLPGKVLRPIAGKPMLLYLLERLERCAVLDLVVVATSTQDSDDAVEAFCNEQHINCVRGPLEDVSGRFLSVLDAFAFEGFVRVNGDSPLLDTRLIERGVELFLWREADIATNVQPRTFPRGQSVEVIRSATFRAAYPSMVQERRTEHITEHFYAYPDEYVIHNFRADPPCAGVRLAVDTLEDMRVIEEIVDRMEGPHWTYHLDDLARMYAEVVA